MNVAALPDAADPRLLRVLKALRLHRRPGWQFPGHYLGLSFGAMSTEGTVMSMPSGPHLCDEAGRVSCTALSVLADVAMAGAVRELADPSKRMATLSLHLSFIDRQHAGDLVARTVQRTPTPASTPFAALTSLTLHAGDRLCCSGEASFIVLDNRRGLVPHPMPRTNHLEAAQPLEPGELTPDEAAVLEAATRAASGDADGSAFVDRFFGLVATPVEDGARGRLVAGLHVGNRVGHLQGGVLLGLVARTCEASLPQPWRLLDLSARFVAPGASDFVEARATVLRRGRQVSYVDCEVVDPQGDVVVKASATLVADDGAAR